MQAQPMLPASTNIGVPSRSPSSPGQSWQPCETGPWPLSNPGGVGVGGPGQCILKIEPSVIKSTEEMKPSVLLESASTQL